jgi:hypothetical protein
MDDALANIGNREKRDAELGAIAGESLDLSVVGTL